MGEDRARKDERGAGGSAPDQENPDTFIEPAGREESTTLFAHSARDNADTAATLPAVPKKRAPATPDPETAETLPGGRKPGLEDLPEADVARTLAGGRSALSMIPTRVAKGSRVSLTPKDLPPELMDGPASVERYSSVGEIGRGGMGAILKVVDNDIRRPVAMKVILGGSDEDKLSRFVEEAQVTGQLEHPNIVPVHELGVTPEGKIYFTMKLVKGESLEAVLNRLATGDRKTEKTYSRSHLLQIFMKICDAIAFAHSRGVVHRDLKPENVMVGSFGEVLVLDWGLAKVKGLPDKMTAEAVATARSEGDVDRSITGDVMGTPAYMPPEQANGQVDEIDARSDVFALGGILYKILTLKPPYGGTTVTNILASAMDASWTPPRKRAPERDIPKELESVCMKAMAAEKRVRYQDVESMVEDLRAFQDRRLVSAHRYSAFSRLVRFVQRNPAASLAAGITVFLVALGGSATGFMASRASLLADLVENQKKRADAEKEKREAEALRAEAEAAKAATEAKLRELAEADAASARTNLEKGRLVSAVMRAAEIEFEQFLLQLKRNRNSGMSVEQRAGFMAKNTHRLARFEQSVKADPASRSAWQAMKGWILHLAGDAGGATACFAESARLDPDVPYGPLFECMASIVEYIENQRLPRPMYTEGRGAQFLEPPGENESMEAARERFEEKVLGVRNSQVWGETSATDFEALLHDFRGIHEEQWPRAENGLTAALGVAELRWVREELLRARAWVRFRRRALELGIEDANKLIETMPDDTASRLLAGMLNVGLGLNEAYFGRDAMPSLKKAIEHFEKAGEIDPALKESRIMTGVARMCVAINLHFWEKGPEPEYDAAVGILNEASGGNDDDTENYIQLNIGMLHIMMSRNRMIKGLDDGGNDEKAIAAFDRMLEINPRNYQAVFQRAEVKRRRGEALMHRGQDPTGSFEAAASDYQILARFGATEEFLVNGVCKTYIGLGRYNFETGKPSAHYFQRAITTAESALKVKPGDQKPSLALVEALYYLGLDATRSKSGQEREWLDKAYLAASTFLQAEPTCWEMRQLVGNVLYTLGALDSMAGADPTTRYAEAIEHFRKGFHRNPKQVDVVVNGARMWRMIAEHRIRNKADPAECFEKGAADLQDAIARRPQAVQFVFELGSMRAAHADFLLQKGDDSRPMYLEAVKLIEEGIKRAGGAGGKFTELGTILQALSEVEGSRAGADEAYALKALEALAKAVEADPKDWRAHAQTADTLNWLGRYADELREMEKAKELSGGRIRDVDARISTAKAAAAAPAWLAVLLRADTVYRAGAWTHADRLFCEGFAKAREAGAFGDPDSAQHLASSLFNHACVLSLLSVGRKAQREPGPRPSDQDAAALRAKAMDALEQAVGLGLSKVSAIETHSWLEHVRKDPGFPARLEKWKKGGK